MRVDRMYSVTGPSLQPGATAPRLDVMDTEGRRAEIRTGEQTLPTVLYVFTPECSWCTRNLPNLKALAAASGARFRIVGLSLSVQGLAPYVANHDLTFPVYMSPSQETVRAYMLGPTPTTIVIGADATIMHVWKGAYDGAIKSQVESALRVRLPGLTVVSSR